MKRISEKELSQLLGGANALTPCSEALQKEAGAHVGDDSYDWDDWAARWLACVGG